MSLPIFDRVYPIDPSDLLPAVTSDTAPYWEGLSRRELVIQKCEACHRLRFPTMPVCPLCGSTEFGWQSHSGKGELFSWVRYQRLYLPEFADLMPYTVITAQLDPGVRIVGRLVERDVEPNIGDPVWMMLEKWPNGRHVPVFSLNAA